MVMKKRRYADGGKAEAPPPKPKPPPPPKDDKRSLVDIMSGKTRRERETALGLKDGGKVKLRRKRR